MTTGFWDVIKAQLDELRTAGTADDVLRILSSERNPYGADFDGAAGEGFFAGSGGDGTVREALEAAGWELVWREASYYWVMEAPNGDLITYVEGDIYRGDTSIRYHVGDDVMYHDRLVTVTGRASGPHGLRYEVRYNDVDLARATGSVAAPTTVSGVSQSELDTP